MDGFMPCPGRRPLASDGLPSKQHNNQVNNVAGIHSKIDQFLLELLHGTVQLVFQSANPAATVSAGLADYNGCPDKIRLPAGNTNDFVQTQQ